MPNKTPRRIKLTKREQSYVSNLIRKEMKKGIEQDQAAAIAYSKVRRNRTRRRKAAAVG